MRNKLAISDTQKDVAAVRTDVSAMKDDVADVKASADHANANANTALMNGQKLSGVVSDNKQPDRKKQYGDYRTAGTNHCHAKNRCRHG